jgi:hypothetical protein
MICDNLRPAAADGNRGRKGMRILLGILAGAVLAGLCVFAVEAISHMIFHLPPGVDPRNPADYQRLMDAMPVAAKFMVLLAWFLGALLGALAANLIARRALAGWIVALLVVAAGVATMMMIPHPAWMWAGGILLPLAAGWLARRLAGVPD